MLKNVNKRFAQEILHFDLIYLKKKEIVAYMQNRLTNSQRYLVNAKPGTNHSTNPTNPNGNSKR